MTPPTGKDTLAIRVAYFHNVRARHFSDWCVIGGWTLLGTLVGGLLVIGVVGLGH